MGPIRRTKIIEKKINNFRRILKQNVVVGPACGGQCTYQISDP